MGSVSTIHGNLNGIIQILRAKRGYFMHALHTYYEAFVFINKSKMLVAVQKRKHKTRREKAQALKDIEKGLSDKEVVAEYNVPNENIISTWVKNKD